MKVHDDILKSVGFVGCRKADGQFLLKGSAFFVGLENAEHGRVRDIFWVTARHVIDGIKRLGCTEVYVRLNSRSGDAQWVPTSLSEWFSLQNDPTCDVAICNRPIEDSFDHNVCGPNNFLTPEMQSRFKFGVTDEVLVVGLFVHRAGNKRNVPIIRLGNVASLDDGEMVQTRLGDMPAYLIECRSIGGLSGSPVYVLAGTERALQRKISVGDQEIYLLGLIHGHYDVSETDIDAFDAASDLKVSQVNTGIAIVTPFRRLRETLDVFKERQRRIPSIFEGAAPANYGALGDVGLSKPPDRPID